MRFLTLSLGLLAGLRTPVVAQAAPSPKVLVKAGLRLTHLFYLPNGRNWQLVLPSSLGLEYRLRPRFSLYGQAEADVSAGRGPRGRRAQALLPTASTNVGVGARYYLNQPDTCRPHCRPERWGNYLALELSTELTPLARRGRRPRGLDASQLTPAVFAFCGAQHRGPGQRLLYDVNAGFGLEARASTTEARGARLWDVAAQVNLRVYVVNHRRAAKPLLLR
jgi:hypothetical protein